jgi:DNA-binding NarL/FixJ family response regulator
MNRQELLLTSLAFINDIRMNNILDEIEIGNTSCKNCLDKISLFWELYQEYFGANFDVQKELKKFRKIQKICCTKKFSKREKEIARLLCLTDSEIAKRLSVTPSTIRSHCSTLQRKTNTSSKISSLIELIRAGVIEIDEVETR